MLGTEGSVREQIKVGEWVRYCSGDSHILFEVVLEVLSSSPTEILWAKSWAMNDSLHFIDKERDVEEENDFPVAASS